MPPPSDDPRVAGVATSGSAFETGLRVDGAERLRFLAEAPPGDTLTTFTRCAMDVADADFAAVAVLVGPGAQILTTCANDPGLAQTFARTVGPRLHAFAAQAEAAIAECGCLLWEAGASTLVTLRAHGRPQGLLLLHDVRDRDALVSGSTLPGLAAFGGLALAAQEATSRLQVREQQVERLRADLAKAEDEAGVGLAAASLARRAGNPVAYLRTQLAVATRAVTHDGFRPPPDLRGALDEVASGLARLEEIEHDLDRLFRGRPAAFEVGEAVAMACRIAGVGAVELDVPALYASGKLGDLARAVAYVLENADEAVRRKGSGRIRVDARRLGERVVVRVCDEGPGVAPGVRLLEAGSSGWGRAGRGLVRAAALASRLGGRLEVRSAKDVGTIATITAPAAEADAGYELVVED
ncbi:MAG: ATP-binding protein [Myxococcota bacterium]